MFKKIPFEGDMLVADQPASDPASQRSEPAIEVQGTVGVADASASMDRSTVGIADIGPGVSYVEAALAYYRAGFPVIPGHPTEKRSAVTWDDWRANLSPETIMAHYAKHPDHTVCCIVDDSLLVLDADTPLAVTALDILEQKFGIESNFVVNTRRGQHRYYKLAAGTFARTNTHSTEAHPERIDVKARRSLVVMPPSPNKTNARCEIKTLADLVPVGQEFVDAVFMHNGCEPPREIRTVNPRSTALPVGNADQKLARLRAMYDRIDPDCGYQDWFSGLAVAHHETGGSEDGFALVNEWSAKGRKYCGERELRMKWHSFEGYSGTPVTEGTLRFMLQQQGDDPVEIAASVDSPFESCDGEVVEAMPTAPVDQPQDRPEVEPATQAPVTTDQSTNESEREVTPELILTAFSLTGNLKKLKREVVEQKRLLDSIALMGQATAIYAAPNTGKTLLVIWMLMQAIRQGRVDPAFVFYINCDDNLTGLVKKLELAEAHGFHMVADGHQEFEAKDFVRILKEVMREGQARGVVIILDTAKKFFDQMDKRISAGFGKVLRRFVMQGGTVILLSHVNKKPGPDGRPIYSGTSDIVEDVDCAYTLRVISEPGAREKVVEFENIKRRGDVVERTGYAYSTVAGQTYDQLLASVRPVNDTEATEIQVTTEARADAERIAAVQACIREGIVTRMKLVAAIAKRTGCGRRGAQELLDQYTGVDLLRHHWTYDVQARGAKVYRLLEPAPSADASATPATGPTEGASHE